MVLVEDGFSSILLEVCEKTAKNARILNARLLDLWNRVAVDFDVKIHAMRNLSFSKDDFYSTSKKRAEILEKCEAVLVDAYWAIKMIAIAFFQSIPPQLPLKYEVFGNPSDVEKFMLKISEKFVNSLMKFFSIEMDVVPAHVFVYGKINTFLRVKKSMRTEEIYNLVGVANENCTIAPDQIAGIMSKLHGLGLITIDAQDANLYLHAQKLSLSPEQEKIVDTSFMPLVDWSINTWRSLFNIRELNTPVPVDYPDAPVVQHIVSFAATQGFTNAHFCFRELKKYYQSLH
ncbi:MAG: hypothetical protein ACTSUE_04860 [Promethearchaeota archaeon]